MSKGINKVILIGNCCADPEVRYTQAGAAIANVTIACNDAYKNKQTGEMVDNTEFVRVVFFNKLGEIAGKFLKKGAKIYIEGALRTRKWEDKSGQERYTTEIIGNEMQMLDSRGGQQGAQQQAPQQSQQDTYKKPYHQQPRQQAPQQHPGSPQQEAPPLSDNYDDTLPY